MYDFYSHIDIKKGNSAAAATSLAVSSTNYSNSKDVKDSKSFTISVAAAAVGSGKVSHNGRKKFSPGIARKVQLV